MTRKEFLEEIKNKAIDEKKVSKVSGIYVSELPDIVKKIVSNNSETVFFDDEYRVLSFNEVIDAEKDLHVSFSELHLIPLFDCGENDFIVYHLEDAIWSKFNIIDETIFKKKNTLDELL